MTSKERNDIINWSNSLTDSELEKEYYKSVDDSLGTLTEEMYDLGYDIVDIIEMEKYEKYLSEKCDLIGSLCVERGLKLWDD